MKKLENVKGREISSYGNIKIFEGFPSNVYEVQKPKFSEKEQLLLSSLIDALAGSKSVNEAVKDLPKNVQEKSALFLRKEIINEIEDKELIDVLPDPKTFVLLQAKIELFLEKFSGTKNKDIAVKALDKSIGFYDLGELVHDSMLEEIMVNGTEKNIFVFHKEHGMCKTNLKTDEKSKQVFRIIEKIARTVGRNFDVNHPLLDARLPDGNRANATLPYTTPFGPTLTIRKFSKIPLSIVNLIENQTLSTEVAAFLWLMVEGVNVEAKNMIIAGGASSGKTTMLNSLSTFVKFNERIVSIEDTIELQLGSRENWIQMEARPKTREVFEVTMDDLLKNAVRMRPDRLLIGEVRGNEAQTMFVAMDTGHKGVMGTLHANTAKETLVRLKSEPMSVPEQMLPLMDLIVVMQKTYTKEKGIMRRISHIAEVGRMNEQVLLANIYEWERKTDSVKRTDVPSRAIEILAERSGMTKKEVMQEMVVRQKILEWMIKKEITESSAVEEIIQGYYFNPQFVLEKVSREL